MFDTLASKVLLPALEYWQGRQTSQYRAEIKAVLDSDLATIREFQLGRIRAICQHAYDSTKFYRERFESIGLKDFAQLTWEEFHSIPPLTKSELRDNTNLLVSDKFQLSELRKSATGGTTQSPTTFYIDWEANDRRWAATHEWDRRVGYERGQRIAYLWGASQDFAARPSWKRKLLNRAVPGALFLPASPLDEETMMRYYEDLKRWQPACLQAYPTPLGIFARFLLQHDLRLHIPTLTVTAEPLLQTDRESIVSAFGHPPFNWYGAREAGRIATECNNHQGMHINAYGLHVEVDSLGNFANPEIGSIILTDLWNVGMPIIRYEIGDLGTHSNTQCSCGSQLPRIIAIEGRISDIVFNSTNQSIRLVSGTFFKHINRDSVHVREAMVTQVSVGAFEVCVVPGPDWEMVASKTLIKKAISDQLQESVSVTFSIVDTIPREPSGKIRFCRNMLSTPR